MSITVKAERREGGAKSARNLVLVWRAKTLPSFLLHLLLVMPIHFLSEALSGFVALETLPVVLAAVFAVVFLKQWSSGLDLLSRLDRAASDPEKEIDDDKGGLLVKKRKVKPRDLHGTVALVLVSVRVARTCRSISHVLVFKGGFTSQGLLVCSQLSSLGAQLILLTPDMTSESVVQMIHLLRDGTSNHLIFAEQCDVTSIASVEAFAEKWNQGQGNSGDLGGLGAGPAGDLSASTGMGAIGGGDSGKGPGGASPRRIDTIVIMPLDSTHYSIGDRKRKTGEGLECSHAEVMGRFHLVTKLLPTLLLLPPHRDIRIVSLVSPWYVAGLGAFDAEDLDYEKVGKGKGTKAGKTRFPSRSPWAIHGTQTCLWLSLTRELQRRIQVMTDADVRPRTKLPGIDDEGKMSTIKISNVNVINVCAGFERGRNVLDYLLPSRSAERIAGGSETEKDSTEVESKKTKSPSQELRGLVNPGSKRSSSKGKAASSTTEKARQALEHDLPTTSALSHLSLFIQHIIVIAIWPLAWLLCKSPKRAAETVTWATVVPIFDGSQSLLSTSPGLFAIPGELHREGRLLR